MTSKLRRKARQPTQAINVAPVYDEALTPRKDRYSDVKSRYLNSTALGSLTKTIEAISLDRADIMMHVELYVNNRQKNSEHTRLGEMLSYWKKDLTPQERAYITYEELCEMFKIYHPLFVAAVAGGYMQSKLTLAQIKIVRDTPDVVDAVVERAKGERGTRDSELVLRVTGMLSPESQQSITINAVGQQNNTQVNGPAQIVVPDFRREVMSIDDLIRDSHEQARRLNAGEVEGEIVEGETT